LLQQITQMGFDARIGGHARKDHLVDALLAQL
jgi:hypothetical protein